MFWCVVLTMCLQSVCNQQTTRTHRTNATYGCLVTPRILKEVSKVKILMNAQCQKATKGTFHFAGNLDDRLENKANPHNGDRKTGANNAMTSSTSRPTAPREIIKMGRLLVVCGSLSKWTTYNFAKYSKTDHDIRANVRYLVHDGIHGRLLWAQERNAGVGYMTDTMEQEYLHLGGLGVTHFFAVDPNLEVFFCLGVTTLIEGLKGQTLLYTLSTTKQSTPHLINTWPGTGDMEKTSPMAIDTDSRMLYVIDREVYDNGYKTRVQVNAVNYTGHIVSKMELKKKNNYGLVYDRVEHRLLFVNTDKLYKLDLASGEVRQVTAVSCPKSTKLIALADDRLVLIGRQRAWIYDRRWRKASELMMPDRVTIAVLIPSDK